MAELSEKMKLLLLPKDPNDAKNVIMEIRGGVGGEEGMLFAADLFRMYSMYAESRGWRIEIANINETELGGIKEISFVVEGEGAYRGSSLKPAGTAYSAFRSRSLAAGYTPLQRLLPSCRR